MTDEEQAEARVEKLRKVERRAPRLSTVLLVAAVLVSMMLYLNYQQNAARSHSACVSRRDLYDGEEFLTKFFGDELHGSQAQIDQGLRDLKLRIHERPNCN